MASSKVMTSTAPSNPDPPGLSSSVHPVAADHRRSSFGSMNMDELLKNMYNDDGEQPFLDAEGGGAAETGNRTVDEVWKEIVEGKEPEMTLEDFLTKAGAVSEDDVQIPAPVAQDPVPVGFAGGPMMNVDFAPQFHAPVSYGVEMAGHGNGILGGTVAVGGGRGKRRAVEEPPMDKATQQKQRRMIKNRESAARSRERKQAYTIELEALVTQLEEENARLVQEEATRSRIRFKKLMENLIPAGEKQKPLLCGLRRARSMYW